MAPRQTFLKKAANYYGADFFMAPFNDDTVSEINKYVSDGTDGQIPEVIKNISPDDTMYLINTVVFNADWLNRYYGNHTGAAVFTNVHGVEQPCTLMTSTEKYIGDDTTDGFIKYYSNTDIAFAALLPHEDININDYIGSLTAEKLNGLLTQESEDIAYCCMLKFGFRYSNDLSDELRAMGIEKAFTPDADFSRLSSADNPTFIRQITHDTFVNVNEKGTFAGAASVVKIMDGGGLPPKMVILDRPFVYCIFDTNTGIPLFIGTVMDMDGLEASED
jgi:serpin B